MVLAAVLLAAGHPACTARIAADGRFREHRLDEIKRAVEARRGVVPRSEVKALVVDAAEFRRIREGYLAEYSDAERDDRRREGLAAIGLWPESEEEEAEPDDDARSLYAGVYVWRQRTFYLVTDDGRRSLADLSSFLVEEEFRREVTVAHEYVHFLQHEAHPELLEIGDQFWPQQGDVHNAVRAAVEGDATRYGYETILGPEYLPTSSPFYEVMLALERPERGTPLADAPAYLRATAYFHYAYGYELAMLEGQQLLERPPISTEQVIHPTKRRERFTAIDLRPLEASLEPECGAFWHDSLGEFGISILFRDAADELPWEAWRDLSPRHYQIGEGLGWPSGAKGERVPPEIWEGWDGDRFLAAHCDEDREILWLSRWDSERDAREFAEAIRLISGAMMERGGLATAPQVRRSGERVAVFTPALEVASEISDLVVPTRRVGTLRELREFFGAGDLAVLAGAIPD